MNPFSYEELQLIIDNIHLNIAFKKKLIPDIKKGDINYFQAQEDLLKKCYRLMDEDGI